jgi:hypothetical protein
VLFARSLLEDGCRFDERLDIYEDWDFWLQVARFTPLQHSDKITAFYRQGGSSDTAEVDTKTRYASGNTFSDARSAVLDKWKSIWSGSEWNELLGSLDMSLELAAQATEIKTLHGQLQQLDSRLINADKIITDKEEELHRLNVVIGGLHQDLHQAQQNLLQVQQELQQELNLVQQDLLQTRLDLANSLAHTETVNKVLNDIYQSWSWRLMGPFRRIHRFFTSKFQSRKS